LSIQGFDFSRRDIEKLAAKLAEVNLDPRERAILLAVFWAAQDHVSLRAPAPEKPEDPGDSLRQQIVKAFIPVDWQNEFYFTQPIAVGRISSDPPPKPPPPNK
jgi:hypothetical protein